MAMKITNNGTATVALRTKAGKDFGIAPGETVNEEVVQDDRFNARVKANVLKLGTEAQTQKAISRVGTAVAEPAAPAAN